MEINVHHLLTKVLGGGAIRSLERKKKSSCERVFAIVFQCPPPAAVIIP